jgi:hypothetical protein
MFLKLATGHKGNLLVRSPPRLRLPSVTESVVLPPDLGRSIRPEIQPMGNDTLFRVVVLVLGTVPVALVAAAVLISPP